MRQSLIVSIFSFIVSCTIALMYWILRIGLQDNSIAIIIKVLGTSAFILLLPVAFSYCRRQFRNAVNHVFLNDTILPVYGLILIALLGYISGKFQITISFPFIAAGFVFLGLTIVKFFNQVSISGKLGLIAVASFFALWIGAVCWMWYLKPYIIEGWAAGTDKIDTLFHVAIAQMIKTYGVPTTGLDGIPFMNYHWGSHWLFAHLSNFLNIPVVVVYQLCYPAIVAPLLFRSFLSFVIQMKYYSTPEREKKKLNFLFWVVFLALFIGFFTSYFAGNSLAQYSSGGTGETVLMLVSESFALSLLIMFAILATALNYWHFSDRLTGSQQTVFLFIIMPLLLAGLGVVKISTLFVVCCLIGYFYLRLGMYRNKLITGGVAIMALTVLVIFRIVFEPREQHGSISLLYFYRYFDISLPIFLIFYYIWNHIFFVFFFLKEQLHKIPFRVLINSGKLLPVEFSLVVLVTGFLPTAFLRIQNYDALYFTDIQMWISGALVLVYIPFYQGVALSKQKQVLIGIPCLVIAAVLIINTKAYAANVLYDSIHHHKLLLEQSGSDTKAMRVRDLVRATSEKHHEIYTKNKILSFFQKLQELDKLPLEVKRSTALYVDFRTLIQDKTYDWNLHCYNIAFVGPAISGMALIDGIDVTYFDLCAACCENIGLGYHYFPKWKTRDEIEQPFDIVDLSQRIEQRGFDNLIYYNADTESFEKVALKGQ